jgi:hypothetical protein
MSGALQSMVVHSYSQREKEAKRERTGLLRLFFSIS